MVHSQSVHCVVSSRVIFICLFLGLLFAGCCNTVTASDADENRWMMHMSDRIDDVGGSIPEDLVVIGGDKSFSGQGDAAPPSDAPSMVPSDMPSSAPSDAPSMVPSMVPSAIPSSIPSDSPSLTPSAWKEDDYEVFAIENFIGCDRQMNGVYTNTIDVIVNYRYTLETSGSSNIQSVTPEVEKHLRDSVLPPTCDEHGALAVSASPEDVVYDTCADASDCYKMEGELEVKMDFTKITDTTDVYCHVLQAIANIFASGSISANVPGVQSATFDENGSGGALCTLDHSVVDTIEPAEDEKDGLEENPSSTVPDDSTNQVATTTAIALGGAVVLLTISVAGSFLYRRRRTARRRPRGTGEAVSDLMVQSFVTSSALSPSNSTINTAIHRQQPPPTYVDAPPSSINKHPSFSWGSSEENYDDTGSVADGDSTEPYYDIPVV